MARTATDTIDSYVSDLLALEEHIAEALGAQIHELHDQVPALAGELNRFRSTVLDHIQALRKVRRVGEPHVSGRIAGAIRRAGALAAGIGAGTIDLLRLERGARALRDDYTAASLATMGYGMLYAAAVALNDDLVSFLAERHLRNYARITMGLFRQMPQAILQTLGEAGHAIRDEALSEIARALGTVWEGTADSVAQAV